MLHVRCAALAAANVVVASLGFSQSGSPCATTPLVGYLEYDRPPVGSTPHLDTATDPIVGQSFELRVSSGPSGSHGCVFYGQTEAASAIPEFGATLFLGGTFYVVPFQLDANGSAVGLLAEPSIASALCGAEFVTQAIVADGNAFGGIAVSNGLRLRFGDGTTAVQVEKQIDADGGELSLPSGERLEVPAGALAGPVTICMTRRAATTSEADLLVEEGEALYELEPSGLTFLTPAAIELPITPGDTEAAVYLRDDEISDWEPAVESPDPLLEPGEDDEHSDPFEIVQGGAFVRAEVEHFSQATGVSFCGTSFVQDGPNRRLLRVQKRKKDGTCATVFQWPFERRVLDASTGLEAWEFLITQDSNDPATIYPLAKTGVWPQFGSTPKCSAPGARSSSQISHVVLHDYAVVASSAAVLRNVLKRVQCTYSEYWVDADGSIYRLIDESQNRAVHALGNNTTTVGIEIYPDDKDEGITFAGDGSSDPRVVAVAQLSAWLIREHHLPFDASLEQFAHGPANPACPATGDACAGAGCHRFLCEDADLVKTSTKGTQYVPLPDAARYVSIVGHGEIQGNREDPRGWPWAVFIDLVHNELYSAAPTLRGSMIDTAAQDRATQDERDGASIQFDFVDGLDLGALPTTDFVVDSLGSGVLAGGTYRKIHIGENASVLWQASSGSIRCQSIVLERDAVLRIASTSSGSAVTIEAERSVQLDGRILATGRDVNEFEDDVATDYRPVRITIRSGASRIARLPSMHTRGANSVESELPGGDGGVVVVNAASDTLLILLGGAPHTRGALPDFHQREKGDFVGYGGNSFSVLPGTLDWPGIVTSGGSGCGHDFVQTTPEPGGNGGNIVLNLETTVRFEEPVQLTAGAGNWFPQNSAIEVLEIDYQNVLCDEMFPSGGNGGRGRITFGTAPGGNGGPGGLSGELFISGTSDPVLSTVLNQTVNVLDGGCGNCPGLSGQGVFRLRDGSNQEWIRASAIGGSGGPRGGDSALAAPDGCNGPRGKNKVVDLFGTTYQSTEP